MIQEDYVSFEVAKLLKEKGFDWEVHRSYLVNDDCFAPADVNDLPYREDAIRIPTLQMAMKWLREEKKLYVNVWADPKDTENNDFRTIYRMHVYDGTSNYGTSEFPKYEEACEAAIKYCLENLI